MRAGKATALVLLGALLVAGTDVSAHRRDEYLQAARIAIDPAGVHLELSLTPGIAVADAVIRDIDLDSDAVLSASEQRSYAERVLRDITLELDGQAARLTVASSSFPAVTALRAGDAFITLRLEAALPRAVAGAHELFFRNGNTTHGAVYLANALMPDDDRVAITAMRHAVDQSGLTVAYTVPPASSLSAQWRKWLGMAVW